MNTDKWIAALTNWMILKGPKILLGIVILLVGQWVIGILKKWYFSYTSSKKIDPTLQPFLSGILFTILQVLLVLAVMQVLGIQMTLFATVVGSIGIAAGLALSGTLQNFTSGMLIMLLKPFRAGHYIKAQGIEGTVTSIQIFFTVITAPDNKTIIVPNSKLSNELITNFSITDKRRLDIELKFAFTVDYHFVREAIYQLLKEEEKKFTLPEPLIGISLLESDGYKMNIKVWLPAKTFSESHAYIMEKLLDTLKKQHILAGAA